MKKNWHGYIQRVISALVILVFIGLATDSVSVVLIISLGAYVAWRLLQAVRLHRWLYNTDHEKTPPESHGLWGDLFDGIHQLQERHRLTQSRMQTLIDRVQESTNALNDALIMTNARGAMEWWNPCATDFLGFIEQSDRGQPIYNLLRTPAFKIYFEKKNYDDPIELYSPAKPHILLRFHITLFGEDDRLIIAEDITRIHNLEQMRKDFVSNVSHELRTPLTVISGYLETFIDNSESLPRSWKRALGTMSQQETSINNLLETIRSDALALSGNKQHKINLKNNANGSFLGDENQLRSAFSNIIFNAVKYTPAEGEVDIHWWSDNTGVHLSVKDNGAGFDPIHIPRLTERFYRADPSRHKETGGSGLGLAIVKHVLLNHDGQLEIKSEIGTGSEFICHFPPQRHQEGVKH
jgi:two-component system phosphate regulon sensor histidine kinase PhoR